MCTHRIGTADLESSLGAHRTSPNYLLPPQTYLSWLTLAICLHVYRRRIRRDHTGFVGSVFYTSWTLSCLFSFSATTCQLYFMLSKVDWSMYFRLEYFVQQQIAFDLSKDLRAPPSAYTESLLTDFCAVRAVHDTKGLVDSIHLSFDLVCFFFPPVTLIISQPCGFSFFLLLFFLLNLESWGWRSHECIFSFVLYFILRHLFHNRVFQPSREHTLAQWALLIIG